MLCLTVLRRAVEIVDEGFKDYAIFKQDFLGDEEKLKQVLSLIPDENILQVLVLSVGIWQKKYCQAEKIFPTFLML